MSRTAATQWPIRGLLILVTMVGSIFLFSATQDNKTLQSERSALTQQAAVLHAERRALLDETVDLKRTIATLKDRHNKSLRAERMWNKQEATAFMKDADTKHDESRKELATKQEELAKESAERAELQKELESKRIELEKSREEAAKVAPLASKLQTAEDQVKVLSLPQKRSTLPSGNETNAVLAIIATLLKKEGLVPGEVIAVIGNNIEPLVERIQNNREEFPEGASATIIGGEAAGGSEVVEHLMKKYAKQKFFAINEDHPVPEIQKFIADDSVDVIIVWDLENALNAAMAYKALTFEANRVLRAHAAVSSRTAIFVSGQKHLLDKHIFVEEQLKVNEIVLPDSSLGYPFSIRRLERGGGVNKASRWDGIDSKRVVDATDFMAKCRSSEEWMHGLDVLLRIVADALEECGITYWLDSGTLLGAYRFNAYNPMEDDHDLVVDYDEFIKHTPQFKAIISKHFKAINRVPKFIAMDQRPEDYEALIAQLFMLKHGENVGPQVDLILAKWNKEESKYDITARFFKQQTPQGFAKKMIFSEAVPTKWRSSRGYLRSLPILGREYPVPYDVEGYSAVWYSKSDFMNHIVMRQMKENKEGHAEYCRNSIAKIFAPKNAGAVMAIVSRMKELFPMTFNKKTCPMCKCTPALCYVPKLTIE